MPPTWRLAMKRGRGHRPRGASYNLGYGYPFSRTALTANQSIPCSHPNAIGKSPPFTSSHRSAKAVEDYRSPRRFAGPMMPGSPPGLGVRQPSGALVPDLKWQRAKNLPSASERKAVEDHVNTEERTALWKKSEISCDLFRNSPL